MAKIKVLITGGSGFIGTKLADELLLNNIPIRLYDKVSSRSHPEYVTIGDVRDRASLVAAAQDVETIYHLAAEHRDDVSPLSLYKEVNVDGARNVVAAASQLGVKRIVFTSTVAVYGLRNTNANEDSAPEPFNEYGLTKLEAEKIFTEWADGDRSRSLTILRPSVVFGEGNRGNVHNLISQIHGHRFVMIGRGENRKSMAYVANLAGYLCKAVSAPPGVKVLNYADKPDLTTREIVEAAYNYLGRQTRVRIGLPLWMGLLIGYGFDALALVTRRNFPISSIRVRKFCAETSVSTTRLDREGYARPYSLKEGLRRMIETDFP